MKTNRALSVLRRLGTAAVIAFLCSVAWSLQAEASRDDTPVDLTSTVQGACAKGELSTDRGCLTPPRIRKKVRPRFPKSARRAHVQGKVVLNVTVEIDGTVGPVQVTDSTSQGQGFEEAAIEAVQQWKYKPGRFGDVPVRAVFSLTVEFLYR